MPLKAIREAASGNHAQDQPPTLLTFFDALVPEPLGQIARNVR